MSATPEYRTPADVANILGISRQMVYNKIHSGAWECTKISDRTYRFDEEQFELITSGRNTRPMKSNRDRFRAALKKIA